MCLQNIKLPFIIFMVDTEFSFKIIALSISTCTKLKPITYVFNSRLTKNI